MKLHTARPGHRAVTPAAVAALTASGARFWFNPTCAWDKADAVVYLNPALGSPTLDLVRSKTSLLYAGPNTIINLLNKTASVDVWIVPSWGVGEAVAMHTPFPYNFFVWPAGVDAEHWVPTTERADRRMSALLYKKTDPPISVLETTLKALSDAGVSTVTEVRYGTHTSDEYHAALQSAGVMIVFSGHESQGVFLFEAWSSDVTTFVFAGEYTPIDGAFQLFWMDRMWLTEPAPFLTPFNGAYWTTPNQLVNLFQLYERYRPRSWILDHGSHEVIGPQLVRDICARLQNRKTLPVQGPGGPSGRV
jgi:hypothetical protein